MSLIDSATERLIMSVAPKIPQSPIVIRLEHYHDREGDIVPLPEAQVVAEVGSESSDPEVVFAKVEESIESEEDPKPPVSSLDPHSHHSSLCDECPSHKSYERLKGVIEDMTPPCYTTDLDKLWTCSECKKTKMCEAKAGRAVYYGKEYTGRDDYLMCDSCCWFHIG